MLRYGSHGIVADSSGESAACPGGIAEEGVKTAVAPIVEIDVYATVVGEDEVADGVCALDGEVVAVEVVECPGVFGGYEVSRFFVCPELFDLVSQRSLVLCHIQLPNMKRESRG